MREARKRQNGGLADPQDSAAVANRIYKMYIIGKAGVLSMPAWLLNVMERAKERALIHNN